MTCYCAYTAPCSLRSRRTWLESRVPPFLSFLKMPLVRSVPMVLRSDARNIRDSQYNISTDMPALVRVNGSFPQICARTLSYILCIRRSIFATWPQAPVVSSSIPNKLRCSLSFPTDFSPSVNNSYLEIARGKRGYFLVYSLLHYRCASRWLSCLGQHDS